MAKSTLVKKLRIQRGHRMLIQNGPPGYLDELGELPEGVEVAEEPEGTFDFVQLFVKTMDELESLFASAITAVKDDGLLWISYPKQSSKVESDLSRDVIWEATSETGWRPVAQVSVSDVWSAMRFRPAEKVGR